LGHSPADFARRLEVRLKPRSPVLARTTLFPYRDAETVWNEHRESTRRFATSTSRGLSYATLGRRGPQFWPFPGGRRMRGRVVCMSTADSRRRRVARASW